MAGDWLKVTLIQLYEDDLSSFYDYQRHLPQITQVKFCLCSWNKLDLVLLMWLKRFCVLGEFQAWSLF